MQRVITLTQKCVTVLHFYCITFVVLALHRVGYPTINAFCTYVGYVIAWVICFIFCKKILSRSLLRASCLQNTEQITHATGMGRGVSHPVFRISSLGLLSLSQCLDDEAVRIGDTVDQQMFARLSMFADFTVWSKPQTFLAVYT